MSKDNTTNNHQYEVSIDESNINQQHIIISNQFIEIVNVINNINSNNINSNNINSNNINEMICPSNNGASSNNGEVLAEPAVIVQPVVSEPVESEPVESEQVETEENYECCEHCNNSYHDEPDESDEHDNINNNSDIDNMIATQSYPEVLSYLSDNNYIAHFDDSIFCTIQHEVIPFLHQWDDPPRQFYHNMVVELYKRSFAFDDIYYGIGAYLSLGVGLTDTLQDYMNYVRRSIILGYEADQRQILRFTQNAVNILFGSNAVLSNNDGSIISIQNVLNGILGANIDSSPLPPMEPVKLTVSKEELDKIPVVSFQELSPDVQKINGTCTICQNDFEKTDKVRSIKCNHVFHPECIDVWLLENSYKCPICRCEVADHIANI